MRLVIVFVVLFVGTLSSCRERAGEDYVRLTSKIFVFNYRIAEATYLITFEKIKPTPEGARVLAVLDNPAGGDKIQIEKKIWTNNDRIVLESVALRCVAKGKPYLFIVDIVGADGGLLQKIVGSVVSTLDQDVLPDRPLAVGPGYTANPELSGNPSGKIADPFEAPCP